MNKSSIIERFRKLDLAEHIVERFARAGDSDDCGHEREGGKFASGNTCASGSGVNMDPNRNVTVRAKFLEGGIDNPPGSFLKSIEHQVGTETKYFDIYDNDGNLEYYMTSMGKYYKLREDNKYDKTLIEEIQSHNGGIAESFKRIKQNDENAIKKQLDNIKKRRNRLVASLKAYTEGDRKIEKIAELSEKSNSYKHQIEYFDVRQEMKAYVKDFLKDVETDEDRAKKREDPEFKTRLREFNERLEYHKKYSDSDEWRKDFVEIVNPDNESWIGTSMLIPNELRNKVQTTIDDAMRFINNTFNLSNINTNRETVTYEVSDRARGYCRGQNIGVHELFDTRTYVHEMGHWLENTDPKVNQALKDFWWHRTKGEGKTKLNERFPGSNYKDDEFGYDDQFGKYFSDEASEGKFRDASSYYVGKIYNNGFSGHEILSMGLEAMYVDAPGFCKKDPEFAKFILGIMDGTLLKD